MKMICSKIIIVITALFTIIPTVCIAEHKKQSPIIIYRGESTLIEKVSKEDDAVDPLEVTIVFDGTPTTAAHGWFFTEELYGGELTRRDTNTFDIHYAVTDMYKIKPSSLSIERRNDLLHITLSDVVPSPMPRGIKTKQIVFLKEMKAVLHEVDTNGFAVENRIQQIFRSMQLCYEAYDHIYEKSEYKIGYEKALEANIIHEKYYQASESKPLLSMTLMFYALFGQEKYDEALRLITPYIKLTNDSYVLRMYEEVTEATRMKQRDHNTHDNVTLDHDDLV